MVEQIEHYLQQPGCEVHIYSQSVRDLEVVAWQGNSGASNRAGKAIWHKIPQLPGPHLFNYIWWYFANQWLREFHRKLGSLEFDVIFSPGINCSDANAIVVHIVFREFVSLVHADLELRRAALFHWPQLLHRRLYYRLIMALENRIYRNARIQLAAVSELTAQELTKHYGRHDVRVIPNAVDLSRYNQAECTMRRPEARKALQLTDNDYALLLVGNDWRKKGLFPLLDAVAANRELPIKLLVVGRDDQTPFLQPIRDRQLSAAVSFLPSSPDMMSYYAAADVYAGPSLHDSFALPPLEAMACGLPVITSKLNGGSQIISEGRDGFVLNDPQDSAKLGELIRALYESPDLRHKVGANAACTAKSYTWVRNVRETLAFLLSALPQKESR